MTSRNLDELIAIEDRFQPRLKAEEYTIIAPADKNEFDKFIAQVKKYFLGSSVYDLMSDRNQIRALLWTMPSNVKMEIYVLDKTDEQLMFRSPLHDHVKKNRIDIEL